MSEPKHNPRPGASARLAGIIGVVASLIAILSWLGLRPPALGQHAPAAKKTAVHQTAARRTSATSTKKEMAASRTQPLDGRIEVVAGAWQYRGDKVPISGRVFESYGQLTTATPFATFDVQGWDTFTCVPGVNDNHGDPAPAFDIQFEVDGAKGSPRRIQAGDTLFEQKVHLTGARSLTLRCVRALNPDGSPYAGKFSDLVFAQPTLTGKAK